ncbi:ribosome recycling factor [Pseudalkalibacillus salsuginis]|uniref:ribosome recycling factor n=1 Tax=Pseudalkalibacillus salsuginis TaxID=2910972 RepID=UPI001F022195|nr:ribosome recycling factor [Pseudalkalibacillus salsuginis]MCF6410599.1 ribosome recycling factor [Pseudalkalibacillus salsuginis]
MSGTIIKQADEKMQKAVAAFRRELATLRAGRANPSLLDRVSVEYYGALTPLNQMANISVPEARLLVIQPYDKSIIGEIEKAIQKAELGLSPSNDGDVIRIAIPALTEERRKELVKLVKKYTEEGKVAVRNIRRDANDELKKLEKGGDMTEDDLRHYSDEVQKVTDRFVVEIDSIAAEKEKEIMEV